MNNSNTNEQAFEALIEKSLVGTTLEERQQSGDTDVDVQSPAVDKYYWGQPRICLKRNMLLICVVFGRF